MIEAERPSWLFILIVRFCAWLLIVVGSPVLIPMMLLKKKWRDGLKERLGFIDRLPLHGLRLWVHAISVGETEAARPLVEALQRRYPEAEIVLSSTTQTGRARARQLMPDVRHVLYPLDVPWAVNRAFSRINPTAIIMVEPEWWPVFLLTAARRRLPLAMVNVRMTEKAAGGYRRIGGLMRRMIRTAWMIGVQEEVYAERLLSLGADASRVRVTGQMKYDNVRVAADEPRVDEAAAELAGAVGLSGGEPLLVAGSTGPGEEAILLDAYDLLRENHPRLRLAIVPRKPERFDEVAGLISGRGFALVRRSRTVGTGGGGEVGGGGGTVEAGRALQSRGGREGESSPALSSAPVILGDTMGELMNFYRLAAVAFVGRSLVPMGGSNPIDPAGLGLPLVFGPHMFNFPDAEELFVRGGGARVATDAASIASAVGALLESAELALEMGERARGAITSRQGATENNVRLIDEVLRSAGKLRGGDDERQ